MQQQELRLWPSLLAGYGFIGLSNAFLWQQKWMEGNWKDRGTDAKILIFGALAAIFILLSIAVAFYLQNHSTKWSKTLENPIKPSRIQNAGLFLLLAISAIQLIYGIMIQAVAGMGA